jgi:modulator of FtsH protease
MTGYDIDRWSDMAIAQLGASAALLGLVVVALSINLADFVKSPILVNRAGEALVILGSVLASATVVLIPGQDRVLLAVELLAIAIVTAVVVWRRQRGVVIARPDDAERGPPPGSLGIRRVLGLGGAALLAVAAITLAVEAGGGLYWWPPAVLAAYAAALLNAWVLLIEILR